MDGQLRITISRDPYFIKCFAAGGDQYNLIDERCIVEPREGSLSAGIAVESELDGVRGLITPVGIGSQCVIPPQTDVITDYVVMHSMQVGSALGTSKYWFEGALICLVPRWIRAGILEKAIPDAV